MFQAVSLWSTGQGFFIFVVPADQLGRRKRRKVRRRVCRRRGRGGLNGLIEMVKAQSAWWWMVAMNFIFPLILGCYFPMKILGLSHHPNWRSHIFQDGVAWNHQPAKIGHVSPEKRHHTLAISIPNAARIGGGATYHPRAAPACLPRGQGWKMGWNMGWNMELGTSWDYPLP